ncbi:MAG TPA: hypothetical protein VM425_08125 [Myxococcota bacterium]|nr:hypothetical protein [Myxococcota bacterium]
MKRCRHSCGFLPLVGVLLTLAVQAAEHPSIPTNRRLEVVKPKKGSWGVRQQIEQAGKLLGEWTIVVAGSEIDGPRLVALARRNPEEPFVRLVREELRIPVDLADFVYFLDDILAAGKRGLQGKLVWVLPGRARSAGVLVHPDDVFRRKRPRRYGKRHKRLSIDKPSPQHEIQPAADGNLLGPGWVTRYKNPVGDEAKLAALRKVNADLAGRVASLLDQLRKQGCEVGLYTTVRNRRRGYLIYGSYLLSKQETSSRVRRTVRRLARLNKKWGLRVPIRWRHPDGLKATREAARLMAEAYPVTYATAYGAHKSRHYDGEAVDFSAVGLPRSLKIEAPDGMNKTFDLSDPNQTRDVNLTPELISWIERHFKMEKLKFDYPHWNDASPPQTDK